MRGDRCEVCGVARLPRPVDSDRPPRVPGPWTCLAHRDQQSRVINAPHPARSTPAEALDVERLRLAFDMTVSEFTDDPPETDVFVGELALCYARLSLSPHNREAGE